MKPIRTIAPGRYATLGGLGVIVTTGGVSILASAAILSLAVRYGFHMEPVDWVLLGFVLSLTVFGTLAMTRFIRLHGHEIGEARFDTSQADDKPGSVPPAP